MVSTKQKAVFADLLAQVDTLSTRHDMYVEQFVTRANDELYAMLADMMRAREDIAASGCEEYLVKSLRKSLRERWDIKTQKNTSVTALVVRYITRGKRQLVHNYAGVIDRAAAAGITSDKLVDYIRQQGSIDAIRKKTADTELRKQQTEQVKLMQGNLARYLVANKDVGTIAFANGAHKISAGAADCEFNVSFSTCINGKEQVVATIYPSAFIVDYCLNLYLLACKAATTDSNTGDFYAFCKANSLNMDLVHWWMQDNNIASAADAQAILQSLRGSPVEQAAANEAYVLTA